MTDSKLRPETTSGIPVQSVYGPEDIADLDPALDLGAPGEYPFTRGVSPDMPVAVVEHGTTSQQNTIITSAADMVTDTTAVSINSPAMIFIGESIAMAKQLQWFNGQSQAGEFPQHIYGEYELAAS